MSFELTTLLAFIVFTSAVAGCLLLLSWLQHRRITALAYWGASFILSATASALIAGRRRSRARRACPRRLRGHVSRFLVAAVFRDGERRRRDGKRHEQSLVAAGRGGPGALSRQGERAKSRRIGRFRRALVRRLDVRWLEIDPSRPPNAKGPADAAGPRAERTSRSSAT